jgi:hypothetical protein
LSALLDSHLGILARRHRVAGDQGALQECQTYDEALRLAAGCSYLRGGDFRMGIEQPPFGKMTGCRSIDAVAEAALAPRRPAGTNYSRGRD